MKEYISDRIGDTYKGWSPKDHIVITAPTGSGKTHFVVNVLIPYAFSQKKKLVFFCNRILLRDQILDAVSKVVDHDSIITDCKLQDDLDYHTPYVCLYMYQQYERIKLKKQYFDDSYAFIIFDEAHYFLHDACFSHTTHFWYHFFKRVFFNELFQFAPMLFMSATPQELALLFHTILRCKEGSLVGELEEVYVTATKEKTKEKRKREYVYEKLYELYQGPYFDDHNLTDPEEGLPEWHRWYRYTRDRLLPQGFNLGHINTLSFFTPDYSNFITRYFTDFSEIVQAIETSPAEDKWLIFVRSKRLGADLVSQINVALRDSQKSGAVFLDESSKRGTGVDSQIFSELVSNEKFSCKVLVSTSVIDNGVNIKDDRLCHIVIDNPDYTTFIQMLGRKRYGNIRERTNLYIRCIGPKTVVALRRTYEKYIEDTYHFIRLNHRSLKGKEFYNMYEDYDYQRNLSYTMDSLIDGLHSGKSILVYKWGSENTYRGYKTKDVTMEGNILRDLEISPTTFLKALTSYSYYDWLVKQFKDCDNPYFFLEEQLKWIGKTYDDKCWMNQRSNSFKNALEQLINENTYFSKIQIGPIVFRILETLSDSPHKPVRYMKNRNKYREGATVGKYPGIAALNHAFSDLHWPYRVKSKQTYSQQEQKRIRVYYFEKIAELDEQ